MRTTLTLDPDVAALVRRRMSEGARSLKDVVNEALRAGLAGPRPTPDFRTPTFSTGEPTVSIVNALQSAAT